MRRLGWLLLLPLAGIAGHYARRWVTTQLEHIGEDSTPPGEDD